MSNILIINGAKKFAHSNGQLNDTLTEVADGTLRDLGHDVRIVRADSDYDVKAEVQNFLWADVVIWQMPGWWMGAPCTVKKYIDDVFFPCTRLAHPPAARKWTHLNSTHVSISYACCSMKNI